MSAPHLSKHQLGVRNAWITVVGFLVIAAFWGAFLYYGFSR